MSEQLPESVQNNHTIRELPSGLLVADSRANHVYDQHPHVDYDQEPESQGPEKVRGISYKETTLGGKPFIIAERPGSKSKSTVSNESGKANINPEPVEPEPKVEPHPDPTEPAPEPKVGLDPDPIEPPTEPLPTEPQLDPAPQSGEANIITPEERIKLFNERLQNWSKLLSDSRFVPSTKGFDEMVALADNIEFRHLDPEVDGVSGMGYFIKGSSVRLNPTQARTLIDKVRVTEWVPSESEEDVMDAVVSENDPQKVLDMTGDAEDRGDLVTIMDYSHFVTLDEDPRDLENLEKYKKYIHGRMILTHHIHEEHWDRVDGIEYYPAAYISEAVEDFRKETQSKQYRGVALKGLKKAMDKARKLKEKRQNRKNRSEEPAEEPVEEPDAGEEEATEEREV
ncbi:MAG TPA: hypothetical protein VHA05_03800 [Candidatus Saccharimonadales bacterium]|nr:hypothetical protein [Candidatus Saccharimonadales bacterium]